MTELYINGQLAVLPDDLNFTLASENPYFTRSSSYSLDIELPMPANYTIFRHINRLDVTKKKTILPAMLIVDGRCLLDGSTILLSIEETLVKVQLVSGNAEFNLLTNDDIYVDELDLGSDLTPVVGSPIGGFLSASEMVKYYGAVDQVESVWLPVFYQEVKQENLNNNAQYEDGTNKFLPCPEYLRTCIQPYLITVIKKVVEHFGYTLDASFFDNNFLRNVYICSAVASLGISGALPHWTVSEFFDELEKFLGAITIVDEHTKVVRFAGLNDYFSFSGKEEINKNSILREFSVEIEDNKDDKDISSGNVGYDLPSVTDDGFWRLDKDLIEAAQKAEYNTYNELVQAYNAMTDENKKKTLFIVGKRYYINYNEGDKNKLREVNLYADLIRDPESEESASLRIVPAKIVQYDIGTYTFLSHNFDYVRTNTTLIFNIPVVSFHKGAYEQSTFNIQEAIEGSAELQEKQKKSDIMEVAINTGVFNRHTVNGKSFDYAYPFTDYQQRPEGLTSAFKPYSLSLNDVCPDSMGSKMLPLKPYRSDIPYTIQFTADKLPDVYKVFLIGNKQYLCEKIEVEIGSMGLSKVMKGTFYRIE